MTKKRTPRATLVTSIILSMALCLGMTLSAFAKNDDAAKPAQAAITKRLRMPINTTTPAAAFTFKFTAVGINDGTDTTNMPTIGNKTVSFTAADTATFAVGGDIYVVKETINILDGITSDDWPGAGVFKYQVEEKQSGITLTGAVNEGKAYSAAKYDIEILVEEDEDGFLYAKDINVKTVKGCIDKYYDGDPGGLKVDPTPGGKNPKEEATIEDNFSQVIFTNSYWMSSGGGETNPKEAALEIVKAVTGNGADKDKYFDFSVKVMQPAVLTDLQAYKACVLDAAGSNVTSKDNFADLGTDNFILFTSGTALTVKLKDGQRLAFVDLHVGSAVEAEETGAAGYLPKYQRSFAGTKEFTGTAGTAWGFPRATEDVGPHYTGDGKNTNTVTFTNDHSNSEALPSDPDLMPDMPIKKIVSGNPDKNSTFTFKLTAKDSSYPMPAGSMDGVKAIQIEGAGEGAFGTWSYDKEGVYTYAVHEVNTGEKGYTYDTAVYTITDTVKAVDGQLAVARAVTDDADKAVTSLEFINKYSPSDGNPGGDESKPGNDKPKPDDDKSKPGVDGPKTGDDQNTSLAIILFASGGVLVVGAAVYLIVCRKRKKAG